MRPAERLLFVAPAAYPLGGLATWLDGLMPALEARGWQVTLGLTAGRFHDCQRYLAAHPWHRTLAISNPTGSHEGRVRAIADAIAQADADVVVSVNIPDSLLASARLRASRSQLRSVSTLHGIQADLVDEAIRCAALADGVICSNRLACELVAEQIEDGEARVHYAAYGVEVPAALPPERDFDGMLSLLYAGRLEQEQKQVFAIPAILQELDRLGANWTLTVAGSGPDQAALQARMASAGLANRITFLGDVPRAKLLAEVLPAADAMMVTSAWETGPIVVWEAMAAGVPVVTSRYLGSGREASLVHGENCLMFAPGDHRGAAELLAKTVDPAIRQALRSNGLRLVRERYSVERSVVMWDEALRAVAAMPARHHRPHLPVAHRAGRLDRWFGTAAGESLRRLFRRGFEHDGPGGEWPHTYSAPTNEGHFWARAKALDGGA